MSSLDSGYFQYDEAPAMTAEEKERVEEVAGDAYGFLDGQDSKCMSLGDFIDELREYDIRSDLIDAVLEHMLKKHWVSVWKDRATNEMWIAIKEDDEGEAESESEDDEEEGS